MIAALWAPVLLNFERVFSYIQEFWGLITPGVTVVFLVGLFWKRATASAAAWALAATPFVTIGLKRTMPTMAFLNQMWIAAIILFGLVAFLSLRESAPAPVAAVAGGEGTTAAAPEERDLLFDVLCAGVVMAVVALYIVFF